MQEKDQLLRQKDYIVVQQKLCISNKDNQLEVVTVKKKVIFGRSEQVEKKMKIMFMFKNDLLIVRYLQAFFL